MVQTISKIGLELELIMFGRVVVVSDSKSLRATCSPRKLISYNIRYHNFFNIMTNYLNLIVRLFYILTFHIIILSFDLPCCLIGGKIEWVRPCCLIGIYPIVSQSASNQVYRVPLYLSCIQSELLINTRTVVSLHH